MIGTIIVKGIVNQNAKHAEEKRSGEERKRVWCCLQFDQCQLIAFKKETN